jgi:pimeloyl-ACP methyl ester carboxylesterase
MARFILVHGMFHGGWCWDRIERRLRRAGHEVVAPDLAGCGSDKTPVADVSLDRWVTDVSNLVKGDPHRAILVGHSRGGLVVSQVAERTSPHVAAIVYLTALMLPDGMAAMELPAIVTEEGFDGSSLSLGFGMSPDGQSMFAQESLVEAFYSNCSEEDRAFAVARLGSEAIAPALTKLSLTASGWGSLPRIYIETTRDNVLPIDAQRAMIARSKPTEVHSLDADHMPIFNDVERLAGLLEDIAVRFARPSAITGRNR